MGNSEATTKRCTTSFARLALTQSSQKATGERRLHKMDNWEFGMCTWALSEVIVLPQHILREYVEILEIERLEIMKPGYGIEGHEFIEASASAPSTQMRLAGSVTSAMPRHVDTSKDSFNKRGRANPSCTCNRPLITNTLPTPPLFPPRTL